MILLLSFFLFTYFSGFVLWKKKKELIKRCFPKTKISIQESFSEQRANERETWNNVNHWLNCWCICHTDTYTHTHSYNLCVYVCVYMYRLQRIMTIKPCFGSFTTKTTSIVRFTFFFMHMTNQITMSQRESQLYVCACVFLSRERESSPCWLSQFPFCAWLSFGIP